MHHLWTVKHGRCVLDGLGSVLVLAPHPDDEVLACASVLSKGAQAGIPCKVLLLTSGEAHEAACAVLAARRALVPLSPGLRGAAVRMLLGSRAKPEMSVVIALAGCDTAGAEVRLAWSAGYERPPREWKPVSALRWVALRCPVGTLVPEVEVRAGNRYYTLRATRLVGRDERLALGEVRLRESRAALRKLGCKTPPLAARLGDGKAAEWWDWGEDRPLGPGVAVFENLLALAAALPKPIGLFGPSMYDRDMDHKGVAAMTGLLARQLAAMGHSAAVFRYLVHHPGGEHIWHMDGDAPGLPSFDIIEANAMTQKRSALKCYASQLRVDIEGQLLKYVGDNEMFWRDA